MVYILIILVIMVLWARHQNRKVRNINMNERKLDTAILSRKLAEIKNFSPEDYPVYLRDDLILGENQSDGN
jgi:hypothetical protein